MRLGFCIASGVVCLSMAQAGQSSAVKTETPVVVGAVSGIGGTSGRWTGYIQICSAEIDLRMLRRAFVLALDSFPLTIDEGELDDVLVPRKKWKTNIVALSKSLIEAHNIASDRAKLPTATYLSLQYDVKYEIEPDVFRLETRPELLTGNSPKYMQPFLGVYNQSFFHHELLSRLAAILSKMSCNSLN